LQVGIRIRLRYERDMVLSVYYYFYQSRPIYYNNKYYFNILFQDFNFEKIYGYLNNIEGDYIDKLKDAAFIFYARHALGRPPDRISI